MSCIPASHSMNVILSQVESQMEDRPVQRRGSKAYQIFPEANTNEESDYPADFLYRRERLPSIVVEPTEHSEYDSRELGSPSRCPMGCSLEEDEEEDSSADPTEGSVDGEQQEDTEEGSVVRKSSIGPSQSQLSLFRLTPPASPTPPEAAPPCLRS
ncbi:protein LBH [Stegastes partitus]|uniref:Protein LBH n=1 Tax=Stegastes partitus TaxID=144197 RepID=A0A9Y4MS18_9TELE|nr:PREDICTED: protein LBH-like [Stegastes partitus]